MTKSLLLIVLLTVYNISHAQTKKVSVDVGEWNGIWGVAHKPSQSKSWIGRSITVSDCAEKISECRFEVYLSESNDSSKRFEASSIMKITSDTLAKGVDDGKFSSDFDCRYTLRRASGEKGESLFFKMTGTQCNSFSTGENLPLNREVEFPLFSRQPFNGGDKSCWYAYDAFSKAWCFKESICKARGVAKNAIEFIDWDFLREEEKKDSELSHRDKVRSACEKSENVEVCIVNDFSQQKARIEKLAQVTKERAISWKRDFDSAGDPVSADQTITKIEGVYKHRFKNSLVSGEAYDSENILEIVKVDPTSIYVKTYLEFANGHSCSFHGMGFYNKLSSFSIAYKADEGDGLEAGAECRIEIKPEEKKIILVSRQCENVWCGARGSLNAEFKSSTKREIRYMNKLKKSTDYTSSVEAWESMKSAGKVPIVK